MALRRIGKLNPKKTILLLCDMQEKFSKTIQHFDEIVSNSERMLNFAKLLQIKYYATEHYPKGLGKTVLSFEEKIGRENIIEKTLFSMCTKELMEAIQKKSPEYESILLCGIESHACVLSTCLDFLENGKDVHVIVDAVSSRTLEDRKYALIRMKQSGAYLTTSESAMFQLIKNANHPEFKNMQKLIKTPALNSKLLEM